MVTGTGSSKIEAGFSHHNGGGFTFLGQIEGENGVTIKNISQSLSVRGIVCEIVENIPDYIWLKAIINSAINPIATINRVKNGELKNKKLIIWKSTLDVSLIQEPGKIMIENGYSADGVAGHSLGEYSALVIAGAFDFVSGLELVKTRSKSMHNAGKINPGTMAAIIGMSANEVENLCNRNSSDHLVVAANYNTENQIVVSGHIHYTANISCSLFSCL